MLEGVTHYLHCSGQVAVDPVPKIELGIFVLHSGEIRGQMKAALYNVDAVMTTAAFSLENLLSLRFLRPTSTASWPTTMSMQPGSPRLVHDRRSP